MDDRLREHIQKNVLKLIDLTDYNPLKVGCLETKLISWKMLDIIESDSADDVNRHKALFIKLTKRGPDAYQKLKNLLSQLGYDKALMLLNNVDPNNDDAYVNRNRYGREPTLQRIPSTRQISNTENYIGNEMADAVDCEAVVPYNMVPEQIIEVKKSETLIESSTPGVYPMISKNNRGVFVMVNIIDFIGNPAKKRNGADKDGQSLLSLFGQLGFLLFPFKDLTHEDFFKKMKILLRSDYTRDTECFVLALMSHGERRNETELVEFHDGSVAEVQDIVKLFEHQHCRNLVNKPKVLLFPFCRGPIKDRGLVVKQRDIETDSIQTNGILPPEDENISTLADLIICYATSLGYQAHRDPAGSWYMQTFCEQMALHAHNTHLEDILKIVQQKTSERRSHVNTLQIPSYMNRGFNKNLYFNPGKYKGDNGNVEESSLSAVQVDLVEVI